jgi:hypothetical protein
VNTVTITGGCTYITVDFWAAVKEGGGDQLYKMHIQHMTKDIEMIPFSQHRPALAVNAARTGRPIEHH